MDLTDLVPAEERSVGYLVDVSNVQFEEGAQNTQWLHAMSFGKYKHPLYGTLSFTLQRVQRFAASVNNRVRGIDIAIDYSHRNRDAAAGWVRKAEVRDNGLWLLVEWTKEAAQRIRDREFRYFSPEFVDQWTDPEKGVKHQDVLVGGGLTNRPFLKNLVPVNLDELFGEAEEDEEGGPSLDEFLTKLREALQLSEEADEDAILGAVADALEQEEESDEQDENEAPGDETPAELAELPEEARKLFEAQNKRIAELEASRRLAEVDSAIADWNRGDGTHGLPVALNEPLKGLMLGLTSSQHAKLDEFVRGLLKSGLVALGETPAGSNPRERVAAGAEKYLKEIDKLLEEAKANDEDLDYREAAAIVSAEHPHLFEEYLLSEQGGEE